MKGCVRYAHTNGVCILVPLVYTDVYLTYMGRNLVPRVSILGLFDLFLYKSKRYYSICMLKRRQKIGVEKDEKVVHQHRDNRNENGYFLLMHGWV